MNSRQNEILDLVASQGEVFVQDLADRFDVSVMTIRRDLALLEREGALTRTHGGAVLSKAGVIEFAFREQGKRYAAEKQAIAREVASLIQPGMSITLDTGTTTLEVAKTIVGMKDLRVLTSSLAIASTLYACDDIELVLLGGTARRGNPDLSGLLTEENLRRFKVDLAVLGSDGSDRDGVFTTDTNVARVDRAMMAGADRTVLAIDHSKLGKAAFVKYADWSDIDCVVTDAGTPPRVRKWLGKAVKDVRYVKV